MVEIAIPLINIKRKSKGKQPETVVVEPEPVENELTQSEEDEEMEDEHSELTNYQPQFVSFGKFLPEDLKLKNSLLAAAKIKL